MPSRRDTARRRLSRLLSRLEPAMARKLVRAFESLRASLTQDRVEKAVASRSEFALKDLVGTLPRRLAPAQTEVRQAFERGLAAGRVELRSTFRGVDAFAVRAARATAGQFVTGVTEETRKAIRQIVTEAFTAGITPRDTAVRVREVVGLTARQAKAVLARRSALLESGRTREEAGRAARRYAERQLKRRSETIARTEIMRASNEGQRASWDAAVADGLLSARSQKVWIVAPDDRLCPYCEPLEGEMVPLDMPFDTALGGVQGPPLHPNCRCTMGIRPAERTGRRAA